MGYIKKLKATFVRKRVDDDLLGVPVESAEHAYRLFKDIMIIIGDGGYTSLAGRGHI